MLRIPSPLSDELEATISTTIGCLVQVHCELGPGLLEKVYSRAVCLELAATGVPYESQKEVPIYYRGELLCAHRLDILVGDSLILELKSVDRLAPLFEAQLRGHMRAAKKKVGLLVNFNVPILPHGIRRFVL
jgi:GxxExxY protein